MSFQNYDNFPQQGQQGDGGAGPGGPPQQDQNMGGQMPPNSGGGFQGGNGGDPGSAGGQPQGGDAKTTLWYDTPLLHHGFGSSVQHDDSITPLFKIPCGQHQLVLWVILRQRLTVVQDGRA